ncbi:hypothetical protein [Chitinophaga sp.]|uniref:hypothetical protein n=1 Tax=Chitinophaga sp. TaxID=1869181 RepID=UPI0031D05188
MDIQTTTIIGGTVDPYGKIVSGTGFKVDKNGTGIFTILFDKTFSAVPAVSATQIFNNDPVNWPDGGDTLDNAVLVFIQKDRFRVKTGSSDGIVKDRFFSFIACGL